MHRDVNLNQKPFVISGLGCLGKIKLIENIVNSGFYLPYFLCQVTKYRNKPTPLPLYVFISLYDKTLWEGKDF